ncbi:MarR family winged helix-turn-helix transcriptional regulator [Fundicoccus culcitae]|uniref:MarR family transcriptional regulator n=1 Tax=Fundicoccus culcitae TaxID=2969821 RepID=A0ABY5P4V9_9LACT|nr:MarR family transcriptional regulator [Fundicoccus culcitae]UUX33791.1 MarR family transcriptional regulator [Fundicoccus culcitae]
MNETLNTSIDLAKYQDQLEVYEKEVISTWVDEDEDIELTAERYKQLNNIMQPMYNLILSYSKYFSIRKDYGTGIELTMIEAHILQDITDPEYQTASALAKKWKRTRSAISQIITKLENKQLIERTANPSDRKSYDLKLTPLGQETALAHSRYDNVDIVKTHKKLFKKFSPVEMAAFFAICESYNEILEENQNL